MFEYFKLRRWALRAYGVGLALLASLYAQVYMTVLVNTWYKEINNIFQHPELHSPSDLHHQLWVLVYIATPYVLLAIVTACVTRFYALWWRTAMSEYYFPLWRSVNADIEGSSQRLQEDTQQLAEFIERLGLRVVKATMTLIAFSPILWSL